MLSRELKFRRPYSRKPIESPFGDRASSQRFPPRKSVRTPSKPNAAFDRDHQGSFERKTISKPAKSFGRKREGSAFGAKRP